MTRWSSNKLNCLFFSAVGTQVFRRDSVSVESAHAIVRNRSNHIIAAAAAAAKRRATTKFNFSTQQTLLRVMTTIDLDLCPPSPFLVVVDDQGGPVTADPPTQAHRNPTTSHLSPLLIGVICALTSAFLVVSYYTVIVKYCSRWHASITARRAGAAEPDLPDAAMEPSGAAAAAAMAITVWPVFNRGLDKSVVDSIPVFVFGKKRPPAPVPAACRDCAVCLSDFVEGESVRQLPRCAHVFHVRCIDVWFSSQDSCPICRSHVVAPPRPPPQENSPQQRQHSFDSGSDSEWRHEEASFEHLENPRGSNLRSSGERGAISGVVGRSLSFDVSGSRNILEEIRAAAASVNGRRSSRSGPVEFKRENGNSGLFKNYSVDVAASAGSSSGGAPEAAAKGRSSASSSLDWIRAASLRRSSSSGSRSFLWSRSSSSVLPL